jgi:hypothetical protein
VSTVYDLHKMMAEQYLKYYAAQGFVTAAVLRLANVYGPGPASSRPDRGDSEPDDHAGAVRGGLTVCRSGAIQLEGSTSMWRTSPKPFSGRRCMQPILTGDIMSSEPGGVFPRGGDEPDSPTGWP